MTAPTRTSVVVIGAGFAGLGAGIRLKDADVQDFVILEAGDEVGGTWRDNTYPGAACDIPSHLYSFSFEPRADWSRAYASQSEIRDYLVHCVDRYGLRDHLFLGTSVVEAAWDDHDRTWHVVAADGRRWVADALVGAIGGLRDPNWPDLPGREDYRGVEMHSARWDHGVDLAGKRVAVVGTGASAIQVVPAIAGTADHVTVFQRSPAWVLPRNQYDYPPLVRQAFRRLPGLRALHRVQQYWQKEARFLAFGRLSPAVMPVAEKLARWYLRSQVGDPQLRAKVRPDYRMGCKRILISDDYYAALDRPDVTVVDEGVREATPTGLVSESGREVDVDVVVYCTGFRVAAPLGQLQVTGRDGTSLQQAWGRRPIAYKGMAVPGFPNAFLLVGPNSWLGHNSIVFMIESQLNYVVPAIQQIVQGDVAELDLEPAALDDFRREVDRRTRHTVWSSGCDSWYLGPDGVNYTLWPGSTAEYRLRTARFDASRYRVVRREEPPVVDARRRARV